mmetsp:Transcript_17200/g.36272  ORF Transcript_17200/g.36272 Transcript_17200/m.36272 type:complete len:265 (+) Transcript_17200:104-898(+)
MRLHLSAHFATLIFSTLHSDEVTAFQNSYTNKAMKNHPNALRDGGHNHPITSKRAEASSSADDSHSLRDGSHNHPPPNTMNAIQSRLAALDLELPPPGGPKANYQLVHRDGDLLYLSGHLPVTNDGNLIVGTCAPADVIESDNSQKWLSTDEGYKAAQHCALNLLSTLQSYLSTHVTTLNSATGVRQPADLSQIAKIVKLFGIVRSHDQFMEQHLVMNGASDLLGQALGKDVGACHARSAIGTNSLPLGICVEVEMIARISPDL